MVLLDGTMVVSTSPEYVVAITEENEVIIEGLPSPGMEEVFAEACCAAYAFQTFSRTSPNGKKTEDSSSQA